VVPQVGGGTIVPNLKGIASGFQTGLPGVDVTP